MPAAAGSRYPRACQQHGGDTAAAMTSDFSAWSPTASSRAIRHRVHRRRCRRDHCQQRPQHLRQRRRRQRSRRPRERRRQPAVRAAGLADNGGPTQTIALRDAADNPALGGADPADAPATDQRGVARPQPAGTNPDIGAFELSQTGRRATRSSAPTGDDVSRGTRRRRRHPRPRRRRSAVGPRRRRRAVRRLRLRRAGRRTQGSTG